MALDETMSNNDVVEEVAGMEFVFKKSQESYMEAVTVDYVNGWFGRRLAIQSPYGGYC